MCFSCLFSGVEAVWLNGRGFAVAMVNGCGLLVAGPFSPIIASVTYMIHQRFHPVITTFVIWSSSYFGAEVMHLQVHS